MVDDIKKCQVFTPKLYVDKMLDAVDYNHSLYGKKVLESSCGEGNILVEIVDRYINACRFENYSDENIAKGLSNDILGFEIDISKYEICINKLNTKAAEYGIYNVCWNIKNEDALKFNYIDKFFYIIGNPPYISYKDLLPNTRTFLKENFKTCQKGKFDYYYAFIESAINNLDLNGKIAFIIPNSIFKNVFGMDLRNLILDSGLTYIYDNFKEKVFKDVIVSPSILILNEANKANDYFIYYDQTEKKEFRIEHKSLGDKWVFVDENLNKKKNTVHFKERFLIGNAIATLKNDIFVIRDFESIDEDFIILKDKTKIEKGMLRKAASPNSLLKKKEEYIIFPYSYDQNNELIRYEENELKIKFPYGYKYLLKNKNELIKRDKDDSAKWFEYGRSQALRNMNKEKLVFSILVTNKVNVYRLDSDTIPYAGIYIVEKDNNLLNSAIEIINNERFSQYLAKIGIKSEGKSRRITCNDVKNYFI